MSTDPAVEPELDNFSKLLPLPFRIAVILVAGVWAWALNLHYLHILRIDVAGLIRYSPRAGTGGPPHYLRVYRLATTVTAPLLATLLLFWIITQRDTQAVSSWQLLPQLYLAFLVVFFILPLQRLSQNGRYRFLSTLKRISIGGIAETQDGKFGDILLADALTSYAKVFGDLFVSMCMLVSSKTTSTSRPDRSCGGMWVVPIIIALPSCIRMRQCWIEYKRVRRSLYSPGGKSLGWGGQHLANALKYSTAFPVILLSALQRGYNPESFGVSQTGLFRLWVVSVLINSFYSFYWDVAKDWDLSLFSGSRERNSSEHAWGLRHKTHFHSANIYYIAIGIDLCLRCTWSLKLSTHLDHFNDLEGGIFVIQFLEVLRRWMWIFFRVETEWVRTNRGPAPDDILLGDYSSDHDKLDYD